MHQLISQICQEHDLNQKRPLIIDTLYYLETILEQTVPIKDEYRETSGGEVTLLDYDIGAPLEAIKELIPSELRDLLDLHLAPIRFWGQLFDYGCTGMSPAPYFQSFVDFVTRD